MKALGARIAICVTTTLVLCELGLRAYAYFRPYPLFVQWSNYEDFRPKPFSSDYGFELNSHGYKDLEFRAEKSPGLLRIVALGDSFAFGAVPYESNYLTLLEAKLIALAVPSEVYNMGIPGTGPTHYTSVLLNEGLQYSPDAVLVNFFVGNDFSESTWGFVEPHPRLYLPQAIRFLRNIFTKLDGRIIHADGVYRDDEPVFTEAAYVDLEGRRSYIFQKMDQDWPTLQELALAHMRRIKAICDARGIALFVALLPDELQINEDLQQAVADLLKNKVSD